MHDYGNDGHTVLLRVGYKRIPGLRRGSRLTSDAVIVAHRLVQEPVMIRKKLRLVLVGGRHRIGHRTGYLHEFGIEIRRPRYQRQIVSAGIMILVMETVGIHEVGIGGA